jgi:hypothetical protein
MGWSFRKSFRVLPGIRINLSKSGPRLSIGVPGARASVDMRGKTRIYGEAGPLRYQKSATIGSDPASGTGATANVISIFKKLMKRGRT